MIHSKKQIAYLSGLTRNQLDMLIESPDEFYRYKRIFKSCMIVNDTNIVKYRYLHPPIGTLKILQSRLNGFISNKIVFPEYQHGCIKKRSVKTHTYPHIRSDYFFLTDLKNFYHTVDFDKVETVFKKLGCPPKIATALAKLSTHTCPIEGEKMKSRVLPQGAPTSSLLANLAFDSADKALIGLFEKDTIKYTRFMDDILISSSKPFFDRIDDIRAVIRRFGFIVNNKKTLVSKYGAETTGVKITKKGLEPSSDIMEKMRKLEAQKEDVSLSLQGYQTYLNYLRRPI